jgi:hypothetical protein
LQACWPQSASAADWSSAFNTKWNFGILVASESYLNPFLLLAQQAGVKSIAYLVTVDVYYKALFQPMAVAGNVTSTRAGIKTLFYGFGQQQPNYVPLFQGNVSSWATIGSYWIPTVKQVYDMGAEALILAMSPMEAQSSLAYISNANLYFKAVVSVRRLY